MFEVLLDGQVVLEYGLFYARIDYGLVGTAYLRCKQIDRCFRLHSHFTYREKLILLHFACLICSFLKRKVVPLQPAQLFCDDYFEVVQLEKVNFLFYDHKFTSKLAQNADMWTHMLPLSLIPINDFHHLPFELQLSL